METLTDKDKAVFLKLIRRAWPKFEEYLPYLTRSERGNLTSLKKKGIVMTYYTRLYSIRFKILPKGRDMVFKYQEGDTHSGNSSTEIK
jgi:hypothetical protein